MPVREAHVLIADDNKVNRLLLARMIELLGHRVALVEDGRLALDLLRQSPFDLLVLDIEMPEMNGFQVLEVLKSDSRLRDIPVIVTSAREGIENVVRCITLGAEDYLSKPVNTVLLKARIGASLEKKRLRDEQRALVQRFATTEVAADMEKTGFALGGRRVAASVMFCDIRGFTSMVEQQSPEDSIEVLNTYYALMFDAIGSHGGVVNQMIGDGLMVLFGAPSPLKNSAASAVEAAVEMHALIAQLNLERAREKKLPIKIGVGIATGEVVAGYTGTQARATYTCIGDAVNLAARIEAHTKIADEGILTDKATRQALGKGHKVAALGNVAFKGKAGAVEVFAVACLGAPSEASAKSRPREARGAGVQAK
jgi:adenylate cyclase